MRRITLTSAALALLLMLGGAAIAGATPQAKPDGSNANASARTLRFDVRFSPFFVVDVGQPNLSLGDYTVFHDRLLSHGQRVGDQGGTCPIEVAPVSQQVRAWPRLPPQVRLGV